MKSFFVHLFQTPALASIIERRQVDYIQSLLSSNIPVMEQIPVRKWKRNLQIQVDIPDSEVSTLYESAIKKSKSEYEDNKWECYKSYLRNLFPGRNDIPFDKMIQTLKTLRETVEFRLQMSDTSETMMVRRLLDYNKYISKNTSRPGLVVKLFHTYFQGRDIIVKVYIYDPGFESLHFTLKENFTNEAVFQLYAQRFWGKIPVITPELYSWGVIRKHEFKGNKYLFKVRYLIMEYIPHITLKEATFTPEHIRDIYAKVNQADEIMKSGLLHHNDLHSGNIMVSVDSPLPEIVVLDFGEASLGPRKPIY
jgi:serine/threonine protein kinase